MEKRRLHGGLWMLLAALSITVTLVFRVDAWQIAATIALGIATAVLGGWMIVRPSGSAVGASIAAGVISLAVYVGLAVIQADELAAWVTDAFLAAVAGAVAVLAWRARSDLGRLPTSDAPLAAGRTLRDGGR